MKTYSVPHLHRYFYTAQVRNKIADIENFLRQDHEVHLFPEATIKNNKLPNGLLIESTAEDAILMPAVLRDPGCGFLMFSIRKLTKEDLPRIAKKLMDFTSFLEKTTVKITEEFHDILLYGVKPSASYSAAEELHIYANPFFPVDEAHLALDLELEKLQKDLSQVTNSIELKIRISDADEPTENIDIIGFIHSGSEYLPTLLKTQWYPLAIELSHAYGLATSQQISEALFGFPASHPQSYEYQQAVYAVMNYCLYKRYWIAEQLASYFQDKLGIDIELLSDRCHAGLFKINKNNKDYFLQSRGVQLIDAQKDYLMAGQKESVSFLLNIKHPASAPSYLGHGTSYALNEKKNYRKFFDAPLATNLRHYVENQWANTTMDLKKCLAYNYNIWMQKEYLESYDMNCTLLAPLANYQGPYLRRMTQNDRS